MIDVSRLWSHEHILLIVGDEGLVVVPHNIPDTSPFFAPADNAGAAKEVMDFVEGHPKARIALLADNLAQDYVEDALPPLGVFDRRKLLRRRLQQKFRSARLTASLSFRHSRRRILMIGLHDPSPLFMWAERLEHRVPTLSLLPVEGARLIERLDPGSSGGWAMLLSRQRSGGIRQIVTLKNDLIFTRLTPAPAPDDEPFSHTIKATLDYLNRFGLQGARDMSLLVLAAKEPGLENALAAFSFKSLSIYSPAEAARKLALPFAPAPDDTAADILFAASFLSSFRPRLSLMLPRARTAWRELLIQRWGMRSALIALAGAILLCLWRAGDIASTFYETQKEAFELSKAQRTLADAKEKAAPLTEPLGIMRQALERRRVFNAPQQFPWHALEELSLGLKRDSTITKLDWRFEAGSERIAIKVGLEEGETAGDRAEKVASFMRLVRNVSGAMADFRIVGVKTPYPSLPDDTISAETSSTEIPEGEIVLERSFP